MDQSGNYQWTGYNSWLKPAKRGTPSLVARSLDSGADITDSAILLASNYVTLYDVRKTTQVAIEAPVTPSWGGNFGIYIQHKVMGACGPFGTLTGGIRAQLETTQSKGSAPINDACAGYLGLYNNGSDVGGFGLHVDAYHVGRAHSGHSTYGVSAEMWKEYGLGVAAAYVGRSQGVSKLDYGLILLHAGGAEGFKTGISLGSPLYSNGGVQGAPGVPTKFDVGIDFSMAECGHAIRLAVPCDLSFEPMTGMFSVQNQGFHIFDVNMSNGVIWQNGAPAWAGNAANVDWVFAVGPGKTTNMAPSSSTPAKWIRVLVDGEFMLMPVYRP